MQNMKVPTVMLLVVFLAQFNTLTAVQSKGISMENDKENGEKETINTAVHNSSDGIENDEKKDDKNDNKNDEEKEILNRIKQDIDAIVDKVNKQQGEVEDEGQEDERHGIIKDHIDALIDTQRDEEKRNEVEEDDNEDDAANNKRNEKIDQLDAKLVEKDVEENIVKDLEEKVHEDLEMIIDDEINGDDDENDEENEVFKNKEKRSPFWARRRSQRRRRSIRIGGLVRRIVSGGRKSCPGDAGCPAAAWYANGCGGKGMSTNLLWQEGVKCACDKHDVCYTCWERYGWHKSYCDGRFYYDQLSLCNKKYSNRLSRAACQRLAYTQYMVVRKLGHNFIAKKGDMWKYPGCKKACVKNYGSPRKGL